MGSVCGEEWVDGAGGSIGGGDIGRSSVKGEGNKVLDFLLSTP